MNKFLQIIMHPFKFRMYLFKKLPAAYFSGIKVVFADEDKAVATIPYRWFTRNPFGSTYFACLAMAAEMSTGVLAMTHTFESSPPVKMLVVKITGNFIRQAKGKTEFTCDEGKLIALAVQEAMASGKAQTVDCRSVGRNQSGEVIAEFNVTWSFKVKTT